MLLTYPELFVPKSLIISPPVWQKMNISNLSYSQICLRHCVIKRSFDQVTQKVQLLMLRPLCNACTWSTFYSYFCLSTPMHLACACSARARCLINEAPVSVPYWHSFPTNSDWQYCHIQVTRKRMVHQHIYVLQSFPTILETLWEKISINCHYGP